jgi:hypothetical protein
LLSKVSSRTLVATAKLIPTEMGEGMEEAERKRFAAKAVNDLLKEL